MNKADLDEMRRDAEEWKSHWGAKMEAGRSQAMATSLLRLVLLIEETEAQVLQFHVESFQSKTCEFLVSQGGSVSPWEKCRHTVTVLGETHVRKSQYWLCETHGKQWVDEDNGTLVQFKDIHGPFKRVLRLLNPEAYNDE